MKKNITPDKQRSLNERKFGNWEALPDGGRKYWYIVTGRFGWSARYVKEVNNNEETILFYQEIRKEKGILIEIHHKFPEDKGHQRLSEE